MRPFEVSGVWWLPSNEQQVVGGVLSYSPEDGIVLRLLGTFGSQNQEELFEQFFVLRRLVQYPLIVGVTTDNERVTLQECTQTNLEHLSSGLITQNVKAWATYIGAHFLDPEEIKFNVAAIQHSYLFDWTSRSGFQWVRAGDEAEVPRQHTLTYTKPADITVEIPSGTISITSSFHMSPRPSNPSMRQEMWVKFQLEQHLSLREWVNTYFSRMQNFLSLATARPNAITNISFYIPTEEDMPEELDRTTEVRTIFQPIYYDDIDMAKPSKSLFSQDMLFTLRDITNISETINRWMQITEGLRTVCRLFFGAQYGPSKYIDSRFLIAAQAVEIYDRTRFENHVLPKAEHRARIRAITAQVPEEHREWLREQLTYSNEPRLLERVTRLVDMTEDILLPLIKDKTQFATKVKDTRNYYTHYNPAFRDRAAHGPELHWINEALFFLLQRCFLHELGFSSEQCVTLFQRNKRYQNALRSARYSWE